MIEIECLGKLAPPHHPISTLGALLVLTLRFQWPFRMFHFVLMGRCHYFCFGFTTLNRKLLYQRMLGSNLHFLFLFFIFPFLGNNADESYEAGDEAR